MDHLIKCMQSFYSQGWNTLTIVSLVFTVLILISCGVFSFFFVKYFVDYKIFQTLFAKISGNARAYDSMRRKQMRVEIESQKDVFVRKRKSKNPIIKFYNNIALSGITEKVPGFSEVGFAVVIFTFMLLILVVTSVKISLIAGLATAFVFAIIVFYSLSLLAYNRRINLEKQLLQFTNACASASMQYTNIIDIFGIIYEQFNSPLKEALERCYIEAKQTSNKELALKHLEDKFDSTQFNFVIDNMELCSAITGDYYSTARDVSNTIAIYSTSYEKKRALLRNAKANIIAMFAISMVILYLLSLFLGGIVDVIYSTTIGNLLALALILVFFYGLNMKTDK